MGNLVFQATLGGQVNLVGPNTSSTYNINVPSVNGNLVTTGDTGTVTNTMLAGSIANAKLTNSSVTVGSTAISLGGTATTVAGLTLTSPTLTTPTFSSPVSESSGGTGTTTGYYGFKNRIINGAMVIDQRNAGASVTAPVGGSSYVTDRFTIQATQTSKFTGQQNAGSVTPPAGFKNYLGLTSSSAYSVVSSDFFLCTHWIEGYNTADFGWGATGASTVTLSFWARSSLTGTFAGSINNADYTRSYPFTYTISSANTWEYKTITISGDTSGTWGTTNGRGIGVQFSVGAGSTLQGTANAWNAGFYTGVSGQQQIVGTNGATFYITGVQLEKGSTATSFDYRPYGTELQLCQRYYISAPTATGIANTNYAGGIFPTTMRATPTVTITPSSGSVSAISANTQGFYGLFTATTGFAFTSTAEL